MPPPTEAKPARCQAWSKARGTGNAPRKESAVKHPVVTSHAPLANAAVSPGSRHVSQEKPYRWFGTHAAESLATGICVLACASTVQAGDAVRAMPADAFIGTLAVITHVNYTD